VGVPVMIIVALKAPSVDVWFREPDTVCAVPEVVAEPLPCVVVTELPSCTVPCAPLLTGPLLTGPLLVIDPLFPLLGGGAVDADPSTLVGSSGTY
jgi:hypothetical protein